MVVSWLAGHLPKLQQSRENELSVLEFVACLCAMSVSVLHLLKMGKLTSSQRQQGFHQETG